MKLGSTHSKEARAKISAAGKGRTAWNKGLRGVQVSWNKGLTKDVDSRVSSPKLRAHLSRVHESQIGVKRSEETREKMRGPKSLGHRRAMSQGRLGMKFSDSHKENMSKVRLGKPTGRIFTEDAKRRIAEGRTAWLSKQGFPWPPTNIEYALQMLLENAGFEYEAQKQIGRYVVDFFVADGNLVFEADSNFWHKDKEREQTRDEYLIEKDIGAVIHLNEEDLISWEVPK